MTELAASDALDGLVAGRSLWGDAWARLKANKAAMVEPRLPRGLMTIVCIVGPFFVPHLYTTIYPDYVRTPPSLSPYPTERDDRERAVRRRRSACAPTSRSGTSEGDRIYVTLTSSREIDERNMRYLDRSDTFDDARVEERPGRTATRW